MTAIKVTSYVPAAEYAMEVGFSKEEVAGVPPSNVHVQIVGVFVERSEKSIVPPSAI